MKRVSRETSTAFSFRFGWLEIYKLYQNPADKLPWNVDENLCVYVSRVELFIKYQKAFSNISVKAIRSNSRHRSGKFSLIAACARYVCDVFSVENCSFSKHSSSSCSAPLSNTIRASVNAIRSKASSALELRSHKINFYLSWQGKSTRFTFRPTLLSSTEC